MTTTITALAAWLDARRRQAHSEDRGITTVEGLILLAGFAATALGVLVLVQAAVDSIDIPVI